MKKSKYNYNILHEILCFFPVLFCKFDRLCFGHSVQFGPSFFSRIFKSQQVKTKTQKSEKKNPRDSKILGENLKQVVIICFTIYRFFCSVFCRDVEWRFAVSRGIRKKRSIVVQNVQKQDRSSRTQIGRHGPGQLTLFNQGQGQGQGQGQKRQS